MDPHPYRLAMSCLDGPPPLDPPRKRQFPIEALILACAFVAAGSGIATLHAIGHGGHVEIGPAALAHAKKPKARPAPPPTRSVTPREEQRPVAQAALLRGGTHDPKTLLALAKQLQSLGLDVTVAEVQIAKSLESLTNESVWPRLLPVRGAGGAVDAMEVRGMPASSPLRAAGFADGDQVVAIDGYDIERGVAGVDALHTKQRGWTVVEVTRANHHVVLSIRWQVP
jgi:hypothetical protein